MPTVRIIQVDRSGEAPCFYVTITTDVVLKMYLRILTIKTWEKEGVH